MNVSSPSTSDGINIWRTWALTITYEAGEYTAQKFKAEKTGGEPVIPSPNLDTDLVMGSENDGSTPGCINLSPAWFQQAHENLSNPEVSASLKGASSENILKAIARPAAITSAALRVMHPEQYFAGL
ncbi:hypothetical protein EDD22DRAFT_1006020 [Suillus occidentalis]|nr:hypothetical protein EDD22DRAFT_1006020 [Suillus occidentalis]